MTASVFNLVSAPTPWRNVFGSGPDGDFVPSGPNPLLPLSANSYDQAGDQSFHTLLINAGFIFRNNSAINSTQIGAAYRLIAQESITVNGTLSGNGLGADPSTDQVTPGNPGQGIITATSGGNGSDTGTTFLTSGGLGSAGVIGTAAIPSRGASIDGGAKGFGFGGVGGTGGGGGLNAGAGISTVGASGGGNLASAFGSIVALDFIGALPAVLAGRNFTTVPIPSGGTGGGGGGGGQGGGGAGQFGGCGGSGGAGGCFLFVAAKNIVIGPKGTISANGGPGGPGNSGFSSPGSGGNRGGGGGGGGGAGGVVFLVYESLTINGQITAFGAPGGIGGTVMGTGVAGVAGAPGANGLVILMNVKTGSVVRYSGRYPN